MVEVNGAPPTLEETRICYLVSERKLAEASAIIEHHQSAMLAAMDAYAQWQEARDSAARILDGWPRCSVTGKLVQSCLTGGVDSGG